MTYDDEGGPGSGGGTGAGRASLTGRAAVLALVVCLLAISLAYPLREYLAQRSDIGDYRDRVAAQQTRVTELRERQRRWRDPAFVERQARRRLRFVLPGETSYVVLEPDEGSAQRGTGSRHRATGHPPWFGELWRSLEVAGER